MRVRDSFDIIPGGVLPNHLSGGRRVAIHLSLTLKAHFFPANKPIFVWCCRRLFSVMEGGEVAEVVEMGMGERDDHLAECERCYVVGELVEYWAGPVVRGYRTDSGAPAFVKGIQGGGWYGIQMVDSLRGRLRRVHWKSLFKDGTFTKHVASTSGARVRTGTRMMEKATRQAEQKFGDQLRKSQRELNKAEKAMKDKDKDVGLRTC